MLAIDIYGSIITLPNSPENVEDWGTDDIKEQYWRRKELPEIFDTITYDDDGNAMLSDEQERFAEEEWRRCRKGFWFLNHGKQENFIFIFNGGNWKTIFTPITGMPTDDILYTLIIGKTYFGV